MRAFILVVVHFLGHRIFVESSLQGSWVGLQVEEVFKHDVTRLNLKKGETKIYIKAPFSRGTFGQISKAYFIGEGPPEPIFEIGVVKRFFIGPELEPELDLENIKVRNAITNAAKVWATTKTVYNPTPTPGNFHDKGLLMEAYYSDLHIDYNKCVKLPLLNANMLWMQLSESLSHLHSLGYTHHDIKPANILRSADDKTFVFTDFGLMRPRTDAGVITDYLNLLRVLWCVRSRDDYFFDKQLFPDEKFADRIKVWNNHWVEPPIVASNIDPPIWRDWLGSYCKNDSPKEDKKECEMITSKLQYFLGAVQKVYDSQVKMQAHGSDSSSPTQNWTGLDKKLSEEEADTLGMQLSESLSHLHSLGYTHHDIKPANIFRSADDNTFFIAYSDFMRPRTDAGVITDYLNLLRVLWCVRSQEDCGFDKQLFPDENFANRIKVFDIHNKQWVAPISASNGLLDWLGSYCEKEYPKEYKEQCEKIISKPQKFLGELQNIYDHAKSQIEAENTSNIKRKIDTQGSRKSFIKRQKTVDGAGSSNSSMRESYSTAAIKPHAILKESPKPVKPARFLN